MKRHTDIPVIATATIALFAGFLWILMFCGCSREVIPRVVTETHMTLHTDSLTRLINRMIQQTNTSREKETLFVFQNHEVTVNEQGDTVKEKTERVTDRSRELETKVERLERENDSLRQIKARVDSVDRPVPYPVEVPYYVERKLAWWQTGLMWAGGLLLTGIAGWLVLRRKINK